jgi:hypothetical protein
MDVVLHCLIVLWRLANPSPQPGQAWVIGCRPAILAGRYVLIKKENLVGNQSSVA